MLLDPVKFAAGQTVVWSIADSRYPSDSYSLAVKFSSAAAASSVAGVVSGVGWTVTLTAAVSAVMAAGAHAYQVEVTRGTGPTLERYILERGTVTVETLMDGTTPRDIRSADERILDAINARLENRATSDQLSVAIGDTSISRMSWDELLRAREMIETRVATGRRRSRITRARL